MITVGIHNTGSTSSACVIENGTVAYAAAEERFNRNKLWKYHPSTAISRGLSRVGVDLDSVDTVAIAWNPAINLAGRFRAGFSEWPGYPGARLFTNTNKILASLTAKPEKVTQQTISLEGGKQIALDFVDHHLAHANLSFLPSPYETAAILIVDGYGERSCSVFGVGRGTEIEIFRRDSFPNSIGSFYSAITQHLGFAPDQDEWKVMGAAAYGDPARYRDAMNSLISCDDDGRYSLDLNLFEHFDFDSPSMLSPRGKALLGPARSTGDELEQRHYDLAAAAQERVEEVMMHLLQWLHRKTGSDAVCLGGGVVMNSVFNGIATVDGPFRDVYIPFAPDDSGNAIGAALDSANRAGESADELRRPLSSYLGSEYSDDEIAKLLKRYRISSRKLANPAREGAACIATGKTLGWFQGRMEFGQRALGNRSILADPRDASMRDKVNASVKFREAFRPFAPAFLEEYVPEYFSVSKPVTSPFMERVFSIREAYHARIPAVVHADGTGRLQTVTEETNPLFNDLIAHFYRETGVPAVLNTSFNTAGEPIVESPDDAIRTFFTSGLEALILGSYLLTK